MICAALVRVQGRELTCFRSDMCLGLSKNFNIEIFSNSIDVINVNLCMIVHLIDLYLFIQLKVTLTIFQGHASVKQCYLKALVYYPIKLKPCVIVRNIKLIII